MVQGLHAKKWCFDYYWNAIENHMNKRFRLAPLRRSIIRIRECSTARPGTWLSCKTQISRRACRRLVVPSRTLLSSAWFTRSKTKGFILVIMRNSRTRKTGPASFSMTLTTPNESIPCWVIKRQPSSKRWTKKRYNKTSLPSTCVSLANAQIVSSFRGAVH